MINVGDKVTVYIREVCFKGEVKYISKYAGDCWVIEDEEGRERHIQSFDEIVKDTTIKASIKVPGEITFTEDDRDSIRRQLREKLREKARLDVALFKENIEQAENPDWEQFDSKWLHVHDWRSYITDEVREQWALIDLEARCIVIHIAQACANKESWD